MGFLDDIGGFFGNLGSDIGSFLSNPINDAALVGSLALPFAAPELLGGALAGGAGGAFLGGEAAADAGLAGSALAGADVGATAAGTDISALLAGAGAGGGAGLGDATIPANATFTSGGPVPGINAPATAPAIPAAGSDLSSAALGGADAGGGIPTGAGAAGSGGSIFDKLVAGAEGQVTKNPIGLAAGVGGLGLSLLRGNKQSPQEQQLAWEGAVTQQQGNQLQGYLTSGTLPAAQQAQITEWINSAKAKIIANHSAQGRSTDPSQNSALAQELNNVDLQALAFKGQIEQDLFKQGTQDLQLSQEMLTTVANFDRADQAAIGQALMNFAKAMSPTPTVNLNSLLPKLA